MRILHVIPSYLPAVRYGGIVLATHSLCRALVARGHEVQVFTTNIDGSGNSPVPIGVPINREGVQVRYFSSLRLRRLYWAPALGHALEREIGKFDIVHLHSVFLWPTWAGARAARKAGVPYVLSPRGMLIRDLIGRRSWLAKTAWIQIIERMNAEQADAVHLTSQLEAAELQRFGWPLSRVVVIPNGVDEPTSCTGEVSLDVKAVAAEQPLVLFFGRLSWKKGLDRLLRGFARTRAGKLAIVGTDDEGLAPRLMRLTEELRITDRVLILPRAIVGSEKERLFAAARLFVLTSYSENFGNTVLEAMRRGVPVIVTPEVGAADIVRDSGAGLVVAGDPISVGAAIDRLNSDMDLARSMAEAGRRHAIANHSWTDIAIRMEELYEKLNRHRGVVGANAIKSGEPSFQPE